MKFIITEEQEKNLRIYKIYELAKPYLEEKGFNNLEKVIKNGVIYYINKHRNVIFRYQQDGKNDAVYINYDMIWAIFESYFSLQYREIQEVMKYWLDETYKLKGLTPYQTPIWLHRTLDETYKLKGLTPVIKKHLRRTLLDETYKLKGLTPIRNLLFASKMLDEVYKYL